jgi:hypothetical protein
MLFQHTPIPADAARHPHHPPRPCDYAVAARKPTTPITMYFPSQVVYENGGFMCTSACTCMCIMLVSRAVNLQLGDCDHVRASVQSAMKMSSVVHGIVEAQLNSRQRAANKRIKPTPAPQILPPPITMPASAASAATAVAAATPGALPPPITMPASASAVATQQEGCDDIGAPDNDDHYYHRYMRAAPPARRMAGVWEVFSCLKLDPAKIGLGLEEFVVCPRGAGTTLKKKQLSGGDEKKNPLLYSGSSCFILLDMLPDCMRATQGYNTGCVLTCGGHSVAMLRDGEVLGFLRFFVALTSSCSPSNSRTRRTALSRSSTPCRAPSSSA